MAQAGWGVELFVGAAETEFQDEALRGGVGRVVTGEEGLRACVFEGKFYDGAGRFLGESAAPIGAAEMNTQLEDGSWHVRSRCIPFQPYFESGFPHGHDQWISVAATNWASMALVPAAR